MVATTPVHIGTGTGSPENKDTVILNLVKKKTIALDRTQDRRHERNTSLVF